VSGWRWDETLFKGAAAYYDRGRLPYAPGLADVMAEALRLDGRGRLLDVGCGPGTVALRVAHLFEAVVGLDADAQMLEEASRLASERDVRNAAWEHARAEELPAGLGVFRVIAFAQSFHWMDRPSVAAAAASMLDRGGVVVHVDAGDRRGLGPAGVVESVRRRFLGPDRRAGQGVRNTSPDDEDDVFRGAGLEGPECVPVPDGRVLDRTIDNVVAETFSSSGCAPHLFGNRVGEFERELRAALADASRSGTFAVRLPDNVLKIWRPEGTSAGPAKT
jgi:SAM-dependent methyltransferase